MSAVTSARNRSNLAPVSASDRQLGWWGVLPPIDCSGNRWWLPLSDTALVALGHATGSPSAGATAPSAIVVDHLADALRRDPPLLFYALLKYPDAGIVSVTELAEWLGGVISAEFSSGEWILAVPEVTPARQRAWSRLMARARGQAPETWTEAIEQWLRVAGPGEFDPDRIATLPRLIWDRPENPPAQHVGTKLLCQAARLRQRHADLERQLSSMVEDRNRDAAKQLAYGLSHEINNPLANISARAQQLQRDEVDDKRANSLRQIVRQVYRAHEMIAGLMFYANPPEPHLERVDLRRLIHEVVEEFGEVGAEVAIEVDADLPEVETFARVDRAMMLEAVRVLVRNSIEAIGSGGRIEISIFALDRPENQSIVASGVSGGDDTGGDGICTDAGAGRWCIRVADSGPGMKESDAERAFDPFFSGREAGRGLGLGLCRASRVVQLHGGVIRITPELAGCVATIEVDAIGSSAR